MKAIIFVLIILLIISATAIVIAFLFTPLRRKITQKYEAGILLVTAALVLECFVSPLRGFVDMQTASIVGFFAYLFVTWYFLKRFGQYLGLYQTLVCIVLGQLLLTGFTHTIYFQQTLISLPDFLMHVLGIFAGYFFYNRKSILHKVNLSVSVLIILFTYFYGYSLWMHNLDFGSYSSEVYYKGPSHITLLDRNANGFVLKKGKITVLDFWFVGCGACMNDFPEFQKLYTDYKKDPNIQFLSVNQPYPRDMEVDRFKYLTDAGFNFPMAVTPDTGLINNLKISVYPTVIILDTDGNVIFKGNIKDATAKVKELL